MGCHIFWSRIPVISPYIRLAIIQLNKPTEKKKESTIEIRLLKDRKQMAAHGKGFFRTTQIAYTAKGS